MNSGDRRSWLAGGAGEERRKFTVELAARQVGRAEASCRPMASLLPALRAPIAHFYPGLGMAACTQTEHSHSIGAPFPSSCTVTLTSFQLWGTQVCSTPQIRKPHPLQIRGGVGLLFWNQGERNENQAPGALLPCPEGTM